jgi:hypothetical protein
MAVEARPSGKSGRPWYLVLALLVCSGLGAFGATDGWETIEIFRGAQLEVPHTITREENRVMVQAATEKMVESMEAERARLFPLAAAELVLGVSMFIFAAGAMMGRGGARRILVQIAIAQTTLVLVTFLLAPKSRWGWSDLHIAQSAAMQIEHGETREAIEQQMPIWRAFSRGISIAALALRTGITALVVVALTRQRARAFFDAQSETSAEG